MKTLYITVAFILLASITSLSYATPLQDKATQAFYTGQLDDAKTYFSQLLKSNDPVAHYYLGLIYKMNQTTPKTTMLMLSHFEQAAEQGHALAMWELGRVYELGEGVEKNEFTAMDWFRRSEQTSSAEPNHVFFVQAPDGTLIEYDEDAYIAFLLARAESGNIGAQFKVARIFDIGQQAPMNQSLAFEWYLSAARNGHSRAGYYVSYFYCRGIVGKRSPEQANHWAQISGLTTECNN